MIKSMTGYGKRIVEQDNRRIQVQMKSLNSKQLDVSLKMSDIFRDKEPEIRAILSEKFLRGKVDVRVFIESTGPESVKEIDKDRVKTYYQDLKKINSELGNEADVDYLSLIMRLPEIMVSKSGEIKNDEWSQIKAGIVSAADELDEFRTTEGKVLEKDIAHRIDILTKSIIELEKYEYNREDYIKDKIKQALEELIEKDRIDENRLEQELIYYLQKIDITEEKVRLRSHLEYFQTVLDSDVSEGKKLSFITQEMGREINTIGSKANDANMQKIIVGMKDELEKIKEQLLNIL